MQKYYIKGKYLRFSTNYSAVVFRIYCALKIEKTVNHSLFSLVFCDYVLLGRHILNIYKTVFPELIFHQKHRNQLPDVFFQEFYLYSSYLIKLCI